MFERLTPRGRRAIAAASRERYRLDTHLIGTEHLLLGLLDAGGRDIAGLLAHFQTDPGRVRQEVNLLDRDLALREAQDGGRSQFGYGSIRVLEAADQERSRRAARRIDVHELLLALLKEERCNAARVLGTFDITYESVRRYLDVHAPARTNPITRFIMALWRRSG